MRTKLWHSVVGFWIFSVVVFWGSHSLSGELTTTISLEYRGGTIANDFSELDKAVIANYETLRNIRAVTAELRKLEDAGQHAQESVQDARLVRGEFESPADFQRRQQQADSAAQAERFKQQELGRQIPSEIQKYKTELAQLERRLIPYAMVTYTTRIGGELPRFDQSTMSFPGWTIDIPLKLVHDTPYRDKIVTDINATYTFKGTMRFESLEQAKQTKSV